MSSPQPRPGGRIVVGVDGSSSSLDALGWAAAQAELTGSTLEVVSTWDWPASLGWAVPVPDDFDASADAVRGLETALAVVQAEHPGLSIEIRVVEGHPAPVLVEASRDAGLLVVGSRGRGAFAGMLLGSVSEHCVTHAHCPVVVHRSAS
jgi:nucleotide-binding universal stress UspA family protein